MKSKFQILWKIYFWFMIMGAIFGIVAVPSISNGTVVDILMDVFWLILMIIGFVGLYGFIWQKAIGNKSNWVLFFVVNYTSLIAVTIFGFPTRSKSVDPQSELTWDFVAIMIIWAVPMVVAHYLYAFRSNHIWEKVD